MRGVGGEPTQFGWVFLKKAFEEPLQEAEMLVGEMLQGMARPKEQSGAEAPSPSRPMEAARAEVSAMSFSTLCSAACALSP